MLRWVLLVLVAVLASLLLLPYGAAPATPYDKCMRDGYLHAFDVRLGPQPCELMIEADINWHGGHAKLRAIRPSAVPADGGAQFIANIRETAQRVGAAIDRMGGGVQMDDVTVLFTNYTGIQPVDRDPGFAKANYIAVTQNNIAQECPVTYYKLHAGQTERDFIFTLAHELFHCIQYKSWPDMVDVGWVTEGTAEYFAFLAKPDGPTTFVRRYDEEASYRPLEVIDYPAVVFFLWLADAHGPGAVRDFIPANTANIEDSVSPDRLADFGKAYVDRAIRMPDGSQIASDPVEVDEMTVGGDLHLDPPTNGPYELPFENFVFEQGKTYTLSYGAKAADARVNWRGGASGWQAPPERITTCDGPQTWRALYTATREPRYGDITIRATPAAANACTCPAGSWQETTESARRYFEQSATGQGQVRYQSGTRYLTLNEDHTGSLTYADVITETHSSNTVWMRQRKSGTIRFTWKTAGGMLLTAPVGAPLITLSNDMHFVTGYRHEERRAAGQSIGHIFQCDAAGLHLKQAARPGDGQTLLGGLAPMVTFSADMDFARAGS